MASGMESRDLSRFIFISRNVNLYKIKGTVANTHEISDDRPVSVASTQKPSIAHGNPSFSGTISLSICALCQLSNADAALSFDVEDIELWKLLRSKK